MTELIQTKFCMSTPWMDLGDILEMVSKLVQGLGGAVVPNLASSIDFSIGF